MNSIASLPPQDTNRSSPLGSAGSQSVAAVARSTPAVHLPQRSYANATAPRTSNSPSPVAFGDQHARSTPLNTRGQSAMAAPTTIPNGLPAVPGDHGRKPSVTITAAGASGYVPNGGGPVAPAAQRAGINFGQFNNAVDGAAPPVDNSPMPAQASLSAQQGNPRITVPPKSPSPIPQPAASGGRPPSGFQSQNGPPHFGSMAGPENGITHPIVPPQGPNMTPQAAHLRRQSSQQSDVSTNAPFTPGPGPRGQFLRNNSNRNSNYGPAGYAGQQPYSPAQAFRQIPNQQQARQYPPQFQAQQGMGFPGNSTHPPRSPGFQGSQPGTPSMQHQQMAQNQMYGGFQPSMGPPSFNQYHQHPGSQQTFGQQPEFNAQYGYYGGGAYPMQPQYLGQAPPPSPGPYRQAPPSAQQQYRQGQFNQSSQPMSRSPSHASTDRPGSSLGAVPPPQTQTPVNNLRSHTPSQSVSGRTPAPSNFTIPKREKKGIVIKDASGNVVTFEKPTTSAASIKSPSPAPVSVPTPPPVSSSTPVSSHSRSESKSTKSKDEVRAEFAKSVRKQAQAADKTKEEDGTAIDKLEVDHPNTFTKTASAEDEANVANDKDASDGKALEESKAAEAAKEQENQESEARVAKEKEASDKAEAELVKVEAEKSPVAKAEEDKTDSAASKLSGEDAATRKKKEDDDELERQIAEMEAAEKEEEERQAAYEAKKKVAAEEKARVDKAANDEELKRQEREAEELEARREKERSEPKDEDAALFASLKKPTMGPGAVDGESPSEDSTPPPAVASSAVSRSKPTPLKLDINNPVEPAQPTPAMKSLKSARMLQVQTENIRYPEGIQSPNPALIKGGKRGGRVYDPLFLMQFQDVFKEKPSVDWEQKLKQTIGDPSDAGVSAGPKSARTPGNSNRQPSGRGGMATPSAFTPMGTFTGGPRPMPIGRGSTSAQRFEASNVIRPAAGGFSMGSMSNIGMSRQPSAGGMSHGPGRPSNSQRPGTHNGRNPSKHINSNAQKGNDKQMPLTANGPVQSLEQTRNGWKPPSVAGTQMAVDPSGHMPPDMVQRKVKAALNKMTPERFDKITQQILDISAQSKDEADGRTLRQVIQLTFEKACDEAHWAAMYAKFCSVMLETISIDIKDESILGKDGKPVSGGGLFRKYLLNRCQEEFEHGWETNLPEKKEGDTEEAVMLSDEYYKAQAAKRKGLGLVQFIGELYKLRMLSIKIMHQCFLRLMDFVGMPEESTIESIVKLMRTVGGAVESDPQGQGLMDEYFSRIDTMVNMPGLPSRMHFLLLDIIDLRKQRWRSKDDQKGPKTIQEIRDEAAAKAAADMARQQASRNQGRIPSGRGGGDGGYGNQMPPPDYQRNTIGTDDLRKLNSRQSTSRNASTNATRTLGPTSMFSRSGSGRQGLGPGMSSLGKSSGDSRSSSKKDESGPAPASSNAFSALAGLQGEGGHEKSPVTSPTMAKSVPAETKPEDA